LGQSAVIMVAKINNVMIVNKALHANVVIAKAVQKSSGAISTQSSENQHQTLPAASQAKALAKSNTSVANPRRKPTSLAIWSTTTDEGQPNMRPPANHALSQLETSHVTGHVTYKTYTKIKSTPLKAAKSHSVDERRALPGVASVSFSSASCFA